MIEKLRIKFIIVNMSIVAMMLIAILGLVFHFTKLNLETENINMMRKIVEYPFNLKIPNEISDEIRLPYFILQIGPEREIIATGGNYYELSNDEFLKELVEESYSSAKKFGIIEEYNLRYWRVDKSTSQYIAFTDISSELTTRETLLKTCLLLGIISFFILLIISIRLSKWVIVPTEMAWKQQKQYISDASHELKTPLTVIITNAELLQSEDYKEDKTQLINNVVYTSHKMKSLVEQMLNLALTDNIEENSTFSTFNFSKLISHSVLPFDPMFFEKDLVLKTIIKNDILTMGEEKELRKVFDILLDNAYKYSKPYGITLVTLTKHRTGYCLLTVENEGTELSQDDITNIFKRFYCIDKSRSSRDSFGLGLSIAENIVLQHKGKIWAESKDGTNYFKVELPCSNRK